MFEKVYLATALLLSFVYSQSCIWKTKDNAPEVYWINMDSSKSRKISSQLHFDEIGFRHFRVRGLTPKEVYIPNDIESTWRTAHCKLQTEWIPPNKLASNFSYMSEYGNYSPYMATLCGRGKGKNTPKELGCTISHLVAMRNAIYSTTAKNRYALIVEDDIQIPFDIDFDKLTASAPADFGILQLFNSNEGSMEATWNKYVQNNNFLWMQRHALKYFDFWSTCAYLIDRVVMKPVIDAVMSVENGWNSFKVVAGINNPCVPLGCCAPGSDVFEVKPPCVWAPRGYQADSFLYAMTKTYMLSMPLITNGKGTNESTFHQLHVEMFHHKAFRRQRTYINEMLKGSIPPPPFAKPACSTLLDIDGH